MEGGSSERESRMARRLVDLGIMAEVKSTSDCLNYDDWLDGQEPTNLMADFYEYYLIRQGVPKDEAKKATESQKKRGQDND